MGSCCCCYDSGMLTKEVDVGYITEYSKIDDRVFNETNKVTTNNSSKKFRYFTYYTVTREHDSEPIGGRRPTFTLPHIRHVLKRGR